MPPLLRLPTLFPRRDDGRGDADRNPGSRRRAARRFTSRFAVPGSFAALAWLSCGSISEPLPPLLHIPERAEALTALQTTEGIVLEWTPPGRTTEAMPLRHSLRFAIHQLVLDRPGENISAERFERESREVASLEGPEPADPAAGDRLRITLELPPPDETSFAYGVRALGRRGRSMGLSNLAVIEVVEGPGEPGRPTLTSKPKGILVEWGAAERATSYRVLRGSDPPGELTELGTVDKTQFFDTQFAWDKNYVYRVRSLRRTFTGAAEGPLSARAQIVTEDVFPPIPPRELRAVTTETSVELAWQPNEESDLAGYHLYRAEGTGELLAETGKLLTTPAATNRAVERGRAYRYAVTAIDQKGNESALSEPLTVEVP